MRLGESESVAGDLGWSEEQFQTIESTHREGMSVPQIVAAFAARGERITEATFRKYVQLGLLPRSHRVGKKGKHRGSQGLYPATTVRQIDHIRRLMAQHYTIEQIQREHLFVRGEIDALGQQLERVLAALERARNERSAEADPLVARNLVEARHLGGQLVRTLETIERRLSHAARLRRAAV